jgi:hypothetical protein
MKHSKIITTAFLSLIFALSYSQSDTYTIRGIVADEINNEPLIGAITYIVNHEKDAVETDENGKFKLSGLTVGRHTLHVTYLKYISHVSTIDVKSGKEVVVNIMMKEDISTLNEVTITTRDEKSKPINSLSYASTRTFSVAESNKFAGAVEDPARMAQSFAGVVPTDDGSNYISIRGNHPSALLYRMEGIDIHIHNARPTIICNPI